VSVHHRLADAVLLLGLVGTAWAALCVLRRRPSPGLRAFIRLSAAAVAVQAVVGIALAAGGHRPQDTIHFFYGPAVLLSLPLALLAGSRRDERGEHLALLCGCVAVVLFSIRAIQTGGG
jgi:peptidoglycan/LPS O-acetylase OafA/YrhL